MFWILFDKKSMWGYRFLLGGGCAILYTLSINVEGDTAFMLFIMAGVGVIWGYMEIKNSDY